ncbi:restriction endonuclease subunit S [Lacimicrobium sp. SS2-24]|uniref:restriction endonuclease subunit S n=1 Tax=Lacimicrobium sp. SS2-24 TaxID=2005569 RepID=UPI000B4BF30F|nr:restriction endonuclease subunit S [Lacimicrobium sp. SS2-24]
MTGKYHRYPEYKDTGVEWLGEIPVSWDLWKLSHAVSGIGSGTTPDTNKEEYFSGEIPWVTTGELRENVILNTRKKLSLEAIKRYPTLKTYPIGSVAIAMYGATIGRIGIFGIDATTNQACCVLPTSKRLSNKYVFYWLCAFRQEIVNLASGGGQPNINQEKVAALKVSAPKFDEQVNIANFLDHETAKIDALIAKQEKLIELLKEKRQAVISHAVTKGLYPDVSMKDSGVEWLGEVPEHWTVISLKYLVSEKAAGPYGASLTKSMYTENGYKVYGQQQVIADDLTVGDYYIDEEKFNEMRRYKLHSGDLLISVMGSIGKATVVPDTFETGIINPRLVRYKLNSALVNNRFMKQLILSKPYQNKLREASQGSTMEGLNMAILGDLKCTLPSLAEQTKIVSFCLETHNKFSYLVEKSEDAVRLLKEKKQAIIAAAVTGKIDVRNWQPPKTEEAHA